MVFVIPMVNKTSASLIFKKGVPKSALRKIYDFFGYTSIDYAENDSRISQVLNDRILEDSILDSLAINYSLGEKNPFVRLPNLPSSDITTWYSHMFNNVKRSSNLSEVKKIQY